MWLAPDFPYEREESQAWYTGCCKCNANIYEGDDYYKVDGKDYCKECIEDCRTFAEG